MVKPVCVSSDFEPDERLGLDSVDERESFLDEIIKARTLPNLSSVNSRFISCIRKCKMFTSNRRRKGQCNRQTASSSPLVRQRLHMKKTPRLRRLGQCLVSFNKLNDPLCSEIDLALRAHHTQMLVAKEAPSCTMTSNVSVHEGVQTAGTKQTALKPVFQSCRVATRRTRRC